MEIKKKKKLSDADPLPHHESACSQERSKGK